MCTQFTSKDPADKMSNCGMCVNYTGQKCKVAEKIKQDIRQDSNVMRGAAEQYEKASRSVLRRARDD